MAIVAKSAAYPTKAASDCKLRSYNAAKYASLSFSCLFRGISSLSLEREKPNHVISCEGSLEVFDSEITSPAFLKNSSVNSAAS